MKPQPTFIISRLTRPLVLSAVLASLLPALVLGQVQPNSTSKAKDPTAAPPPGSQLTGAAGSEAQPRPPLPAALARGILEEEGNLNLRGAMNAYQEVITQFDEQRRHVALAVFRLGQCYRKLGQTNEAQIQYQRILREFPDQTEIVRLCQTMTTTGQPSLTAEQPDTELERIKNLSRQSPDLINAIGFDGATPLQAAAGKGQIEVVRFLLDQGVSTDRARLGELTPLHFAAGNGHLAIVSLLLQRGAKADAENEGGVTPLHLAAFKGYLQVAKTLLDAGAQVNLATRSRSTWERDYLSFNFAPGTSPLEAAVYSRDVGLIKLLLERGAAVNAPFSQGGTALHYAVAFGQGALLEILIRAGADLNVKNTFGNSPLHRAAAEGYLPLIKALIEAKANLDAINPEGQTPLLIAAQNRRREAAEMLLSLGANPNLAARSGLTPLHYAVAAQDEDFARKLLERGANPNLEAKAEENRSAAASELNRPNMTGAGRTNLLIKIPINGTPLVLACDLNQVPLAKLLLEHGANPNVPSIGANGPLIFHPTVWGNLELLELLLTHKGDPNLTNDINGETSLHRIILEGPTNALSTLIAHGAKVDAVTKQGSTPLHYAVSLGRLEMVEALIAAKANLNVPDAQGKTPLDLTKSTRGGFGGSLPRPDHADDIALALRRAGALEEIPHLDRIEVRRTAADFAEVLYQKGTNDWNRFTLFELIADWYGLITTSQEWRINKPRDPRAFFSTYARPYNLHPDFSCVVIRRPAQDGRAWTDRIVDLSGAFSRRDCGGDISLEWGDIVEIPETDHPINEPWTGLSEPVLETLQKCLTRHLEIRSNSQTNRLTLSLSFPVDNRIGASIEPEVPFMLRPALLRSNLISASSNLTQVKVTRNEAATGQSRTWTLNCATPQIAPEFWLRDGDQIEVLEK